MTVTPGCIVFFPVQPHVYKYLQAKCGEKLVAAQKNLWGEIILDLFNKRSRSLTAITSELKFPVEITLPYLERYGVNIDKQVIYRFNSRIDDIMREEMRTYVFLTNKNHQVPKDKALREFLNEYNLTEDDIKFETLKKDLVRSKKTN